MEFLEITKESKVYPGEYLLHTPTNQIVMCGAYKPAEETVRFLAHGRLQEDNIKNFQKLKVTARERKEGLKRKCGGCKKR